MSDKSSHPSYRADVDGLRAIAVLVVIIYHAFPKFLPGGFIGVDVFFVISGFVITRTILKELNANHFSIMAFYARRCRRILPSLITVLLACWLIGWKVLLSGEYLSLAKHILAGTTFTSNFRLLHEAGYFDAAAELKPLLHLWSLAVEEQFYLLWPLILMALFKFRRNIVTWTVVLILISFAINIFAVGRSQLFAFYMLPTRFWELLFGCMLASIEPSTEAKFPLARRNPLLSIFALALILGGSHFISRALAFPGWWALAPTVGAAILIWTGTGNWINRNILGNRIFVYIGLISYPLYLWHWPLLSFLRTTEHPAPNALVRCSAVAVSFALAAATYKWIEVPVRDRLFSTKPPSLKLRSYLRWGFVALVAVSAVGLITKKQNGLPNRYPSFERQSLAGYIDCSKELKIGEGYCRKTKGAPAIAIVGDSRASNLFSGWIQGSTQPSILLGGNSCPFILDVGVNVNEDCERINGIVLNRLSDPKIKTVILVSRGPRYFNNDVSSEITELDPAPKAWKLIPKIETDKDALDIELFKSGYLRGISKLEHLKKRIIFVTEWPEPLRDPLDCISNRPFSFFTKSNPELCKTSLSDFEKRHRDYRKTVEIFRTKFPRLRVYDPLPYFCDNEICYLKKEGPFYSDRSGHINVETAKALAADLKNVAN